MPFKTEVLGRIAEAVRAHGSTQSEVHLRQHPNRRPVSSRFFENTRSKGGPIDNRQKLVASLFFLMEPNAVSTIDRGVSWGDDSTRLYSH